VGTWFNVIDIRISVQSAAEDGRLGRRILLSFGGHHEFEADTVAALTAGGKGLVDVQAYFVRIAMPPVQDLIYSRLRYCLPRLEQVAARTGSHTPRPIEKES
jgi:hypothetical protein